MTNNEMMKATSGRDTDDGDNKIGLNSFRKAVMVSWGLVRCRACEFGKHKGVAWENIPIAYIEWLASESRGYTPESGVVRYRNAIRARMELQFRKNGYLLS